ncbi:hypothetical protein [Brevundimonas vesicularis]|uniref:hypothetical protein n=1 Tax=Brevundimonas vesicularis TaxID=41276 RepID=UPI0038D3EB45
MRHTAPVDLQGGFELNGRRFQARDFLQDRSKGPSGLVGDDARVVEAALTNRRGAVQTVVIETILQRPQADEEALIPFKSIFIEELFKACFYRRA